VASRRCGPQAHAPRHRDPDLPLGQLRDAFATLLGGQARGRFVVDLSEA
jgi:hypothetical protein